MTKVNGKYLEDLEIYMAIMCPYSSQDRKMVMANREWKSSEFSKGLAAGTLNDHENLLLSWQQCSYTMHHAGPDYLLQIDKRNT